MSDTQDPIELTKRKIALYLRARNKYGPRFREFTHKPVTECFTESPKYGLMYWFDVNLGDGQYTSKIESERRPVKEVASV